METKRRQKHDKNPRANEIRKPNENTGMTYIAQTEEIRRLKDDIYMIGMEEDTKYGYQKQTTHDRGNVDTERGQIHDKDSSTKEIRRSKEDKHMKNRSTEEIRGPKENKHM